MNMTRQSQLTGVMVGAPDRIDRRDTGLVIAEDISFEEWSAMGDWFQAAERSLMWWIGDWVRFGERKWGDKYTEAIAATGRSYQSVADAKWVAEKFADFSCRHEKLSFTHHREAAALPIEEAKRLLDQAEAEGWSKRAIRAAVQSIKQLTKEDDEAMLLAEVEQTIESDTKPNNILNPPDGKSVEDWGRFGLSKESQGLTLEEIADTLGVYSKTYSQLREIILLAENTCLSKRDAAIARKSLAMANATKQVKAPHDAIAGIADRVWGERANALRRGQTVEAKRLERFEHAFGLVMQACEDAAEMNVPYLSEDQANEAVRKLATATQHLRELSKRIMEIHS